MNISKFHTLGLTFIRLKATTEGAAKPRTPSFIQTCNLITLVFCIVYITFGSAAIRNFNWNSLRRLTLLINQLCLPAMDKRPLCIKEGAFVFEVSQMWVIRRLYQVCNPKWRIYNRPCVNLKGPPLFQFTFRDFGDKYGVFKAYLQLLYSSFMNSYYWVVN